ncbi:MAG: carbohydrate binding domain-containing protein [Bacteroidia bacterium]|nr:carbohydrate binding domain-containing protein [Bacteroidia bacterium]
MLIFLLTIACLSLDSCSEKNKSIAGKPGVAVLLVDTDRKTRDVEEDIYGQFLEHINHSVVDGLYAEQIRGLGFEGNDFETYWKPVEEKGSARIVKINFENGEKSLRLQAENGTAGIRQDRIYLQNGHEYKGSVWIKPEAGSLQIVFRIKDSTGHVIAERPLITSGSEWQELGYSFSSSKTDTQASVEIMATGNGSVLLDFISMMSAEALKNGKLRLDLLKSLRDLNPPFIRWPGGSFASIYKWKDGIGPQVSRKYHPNEIWGGYSDYYGFGTDEFMELCRQLNSKPLIVLNATTTDPEQVEYAMDWVHYLNDPATTKWGKMRGDNGHPEPYNVQYFQIDNEPMNHELTPDQYAAIVNAYGSRLREIAPHARIIACGQKRSNDMNWSEKIIDIAGKNFDILGCHNYEYENENFQTGVQRINDYLVKLRDYIHASEHPEIKIAVLEWGLCRSYDWRAGLHTAGNLIMYEKLSPQLEMTCPALLMRNTTDDSTWRAFIYHDHVSWFPGSGYIVEKLFRDHYAKKYFASTAGTFNDRKERKSFFDDISQTKPEDWKPGTVDAVATGSEDGKRIVIKAVNYTGNTNMLLVRLQGSMLPAKASMKLYTLSAGLTDAPSMEHPDKIKPVEHSMPYDRDLTIELAPFTVLVAEIVAE